MAKLDRRILKEQAAARLDQESLMPQKMVFIHTGVTVLLNLVNSLLGVLLSDWISGNSGLSGIGIRSVLQTAQSVFQIGVMLFSPFWSASLIKVALHWADGKETRTGDLLSGFRRASAIVGFEVCMMILLFGAGMLCSYAAIFLFTLFPGADPGSVASLGAESGTASLWTLVYCVLLVLVVAFLGYSTRLSSYFIMDRSEMGGFAAVRTSIRAMKGHRLEMLKLDLGYWWYYLLECLLVVICYLGELLPLAGFTIPMDADVFLILLMAVYCVLELGLHVRVKPKMETVYALAYRTIVEPDRTEEEYQ